MTEPNNHIMLAHGGGGRLMADLIGKTIRPHLAAGAGELLDSATVAVGKENILFTADSFVVNPLFFPGGDIGKLAVCGTVNDLAVCGGKPAALSLSLIIEEGFDIAALERICRSIGQTAAAAGVPIVTGDTKVVEKGAADGLFINTSGIAQKLPAACLGFDRIGAGDAVLVNGTLGDHGLTIMSKRQELSFDSSIESDCACLHELTAMLIDAFGADIRFMRDATRGGLAAVANEIAASSGCSIELQETAIGIKPAVRAAADMLGLDILNAANEGKFVAVVAAAAADKAAALLRTHPLGKDAAIIGKVIEKETVPLVELITKIGGRRIVQMPYGRELPRIC